MVAVLGLEDVDTVVLVTVVVVLVVAAAGFSVGFAVVPVASRSSPRAYDLSILAYMSSRIPLSVEVVLSIAQAGANGTFIDLMFFNASLV